MRYDRAAASLGKKKKWSTGLIIKTPTLSEFHLWFIRRINFWSHAVTAVVFFFRGSELHFLFSGIRLWIRCKHSLRRKGTFFCPSLLI